MQSYPNRGLPLEDKVAVVTGASSGIGAATARAMAKAGASVALLARREDRLEALASELREDGREAVAVRTDLRDPDSIVAAAEAVEKDLGRTDILVNNAGLAQVSPFADRRIAEWREMIEVNLIGALEATAAFLDQLLEGGGDIVNVTSISGRKAGPTKSIYAATKFAVHAWSEALRQELLDQRVRVIVVGPGSVKTEIQDQIGDDALREAAKRRAKETDALIPEDVAGAIMFAVCQPARVSVSEILIRPTRQPF